MRITAIVISLLLSVSHLAAQPYVAQRNAEPSRSAIVPYNKASDAAVANIAASTYVERVTEWATSEDGRSFSARITLPVAWLNRQILVRVGRSTSAYEIDINGKNVGYAASGAVASEFNVTKALHTGKNDLVIRHIDSPTNSLSTSYATSKPSIGDVVVVCQPVIRVRDIVYSTRINDSGEGVVEFAIPVKCDALNPKSATINYILRLNDTTVLARGKREISLDMRREDTVRFVARVPKEALWSASSPQIATLDLDNRINGRASEFIRRNIGIRAADLQHGRLYVNRRAVDLRLTDYDPSRSLDEQLGTHANGIICSADVATEALLDECDRRGIYVFVRASLDSRNAGNSIRRGGNPTNNPQWVDTYLSLNRSALYATRHHPSVVGYAVANGTTTGYNIYESYLLMKSLEPRLPIIYEGAAGEWCSDRLPFR